MGDGGVPLETPSADKQQHRSLLPAAHIPVVILEVIVILLVLFTI